MTPHSMFSALLVATLISSSAHAAAAVAVAKSAAPKATPEEVMLKELKSIQASAEYRELFEIAKAQDAESLKVGSSLQFRCSRVVSGSTSRSFSVNREVASMTLSGRKCDVYVQSENGREAKKSFPVYGIRLFSDPNSEKGMANLELMEKWTREAVSNNGTLSMVAKDGIAGETFYSATARLKAAVNLWMKLRAQCGKEAGDLIEKMKLALEDSAIVKSGATINAARLELDISQ